MAVELINIDCLEYMKGLPDKAFQLAICDPPYGINAPSMNMGVNHTRVNNGKSSGAVELQKKNRLQRLNGGGGKLKNRILNTSKIEWDNEKPSQEYFDQLFRVSVNQIIWGGNYFPLPPTRCIICWNKLQPWENFSQWEMAWTSFDSPARLFTYSNTGGNNQEPKIHPTQKPIKLYKWLLQNYALCKKCNNTGNIYEDVVGDGGSRMLVECEYCDGIPKILDTHLGSGSSAIAAHQMGFDFVGTEIDKDYYDAACKRFKEQTMQQDLFKPAV